MTAPTRIPVAPLADDELLRVALDAAEQQRARAWREVVLVSRTVYRTHALRHRAEVHARHAAHRAETAYYAALMRLEGIAADGCAHANRCVSDPEIGLCCIGCYLARHPIDAEHDAEVCATVGVR